MDNRFERGSIDEYYFLVIKECRAYDAYYQIVAKHPVHQALVKAQEEFKESSSYDWEELHKNLKKAEREWEIEKKKIPEYNKWVSLIPAVSNHKLHFEDLNKRQMAEEWFENKY